MPYRNHVFISYAHDNNKPVDEGGRGWVEQFQRALDAFLGRRYGKAKIWRDERLRGNDDFSGEIFAQFPDTALMVAVISPSYVQSKWCCDEASKFCEIAQRPPGLVINNKMRAFKVILEPVPNQDPLPAPMRNALGFEFYVREDSRVRELDPAFGEKMKEKFLLAIADLAGEIADLLHTLESLQAGVRSAAPGPDADGAATVTSSAVYLAECSYDRREDRKALNAELRARNYHVLPDRELPRDEAEYRAEVARLLESCVLSIHLVGNIYGSVPDGPSQCAGVVIQNELAVTRAHSAGLKRVISLLAGTHSDDAKQQTFIEAIHRDPEVQFNAEVITAGVEAVKTAVLTALAPHAPASAPEEPGDGASIYVIFDAKDRKDETLLQLRKCLLARGLALSKPAFDGDAEEVRRTHEGHLDECDAVLIYYGRGTDSWKQSIDRDVEKAKGRRGKRKLRAVFNWIAAPTCDDKDDIIAEGAAANLIDARAGVSERLVDEKIVKVVLGERS
jgi:hypothetical protein